MKDQVKFVKGGVMEPVVSIELNGRKYYASYYISKNYK